MANNSTTSDNDYSEEEYLQAFAIAKEALGCIAQFQTPPTPDVYEVWYRYSEGKNQALLDSLAYCVNDAKSVSKLQIRQVQQAFFTVAESAAENARINDELAEELGGLKSIVSDQIAASGAFDESLGSAAENLSPTSTPNETKASIELAMSCTDEMKGHLKKVTSQLERSQGHIDDMRETLMESQKLLLVDPVTEVGNRRFFDAMMNQYFERPRNPQHHHFLIIVDLDNFKDVNDTHGHLIGDRVLKYAASTLKSISKEASIARYGGDEFAIFLESDQSARGKDLGEAICEHFANTSLKDEHAGVTLDRVTTSIGISRLREDDDRESWFDRADKLLYNAKQLGRNRVVAERDLSESRQSDDQ